jgi:predicted enzyme related to lactoylglutathione lyase
MNQVQVEQKSYQMPPRDGFTVAHFITVADIERSARFYETVFGGRILSRGDSSGAPGYIQIANTWLIVNVGGGPTPDKPSVTLSVPADPDSVSSFMNIRVADIQACYALWRSRGAEFITEPKDKYGETRCYIRDPDGYIIEVGRASLTAKRHTLESICGDRVRRLELATNQIWNQSCSPGQKPFRLRLSNSAPLVRPSMRSN